MKIHVGDVNITKENVEDFKDLVNIDGNLSIETDLKVELRYLEGINGSIMVRSGAVLTAPSMWESGSMIMIFEGGTLNALKLQEATHLIVHSYGTIIAPILDRVNDMLWLGHHSDICTLKLNVINGSMYIQPKVKLKTGNRLEIYRDLTIYKYGIYNIDSINHIDGHLRLESKTVLTVNNLKIVKGDIITKENSFLTAKNLETFRGAIDSHGEYDIPKLELEMA